MYIVQYMVRMNMLEAVYAVLFTHDAVRELMN